ncbi:hypothetical protein GE21DRAFT_1055453 [Neurospora crassa]|nr:hypothetical protein GE21DRAFT_1055453 [Neurospora crassa]
MSKLTSSIKLHRPLVSHAAPAYFGISCRKSSRMCLNDVWLGLAQPWPWAGCNVCVSADPNCFCLAFYLILPVMHFEPPLCRLSRASQSGQQLIRLH